MTSKKYSHFQFDEYRLDCDKKLIFKHGECIEIEARVYELIEYVVSQYPKTLTRVDLMDHLWPMQEVSDASLAQLIRRARISLNDNGRNPKYIKTVHGVGLRWLVDAKATDDFSVEGQEAEVRQEESTVTSADISVKRTPWKSWRFFAAGIALTAILALAGFFIIKKNSGSQLLDAGYPYSIAILPFINATNDARNAWVELGLMDMVGQLVDESAGIDTVATTQVLAILSSLSSHADKEKGIQAGFASAEQNDRLFEKVCGSLGCNLLLAVRVSGQPEANTMEYQLITSQGSFPLQVIKQKGVLKAATRLANEVIHRVDPAQPWLVDVSQTYSYNTSANQAYALGVQALFDQDLPVAKQYLQIALKQHPEFFWAQVRLAEVDYYLSDWNRSAIRIEHLIAKKDLNKDIYYQALHVKSNILLSRETRRVA